MTKSEKSDLIADSMGLGGLLLHKVMPPLYWLCLITDQKYECSSDYEEEYLNKSLEELTK